MTQVKSNEPVIGAVRESPATPSHDVKNLVRAVLKKLEEGGLNGIYAWFADRPNVIVNRVDSGLYSVLLWREGVVLELLVDDSLDVKYVDVHYYQEPVQ
jgi:hypothetical protein